MPPPEPAFLFTRKLDELRLPYMVTGGMAAIFYGEPRFTNDVDIVVALKPEDLPRLQAAFPLDDFYCPPSEVLKDEAGRSRRGHFNLIHHKSGFKADIYVAGSDPLHGWGLARARKEDLEGELVAFAPPEYVIVKKLEFFAEGESSKHLRDIQRMLICLGEGWNRSALLELVEEHGLQAEWARALGPTVS
ncbi:MAG TPA: hypothetical protein VF950_20470 [Planctomycetota bacterium]